MAFVLQNFDLLSGSRNKNVPAFYGYSTTTDAIATVVASAYFNSAKLTFNNMAIGDFILVNTTDEKQFLKVTAVTPNVTTEVATQSDIRDGVVTNAKVAANAAIAFSKLAALTSGNILVGNGSNVADSVAMSGDATLSNAGVLTIANLAVSAAKLAADAVTTAKILDANVTTAKIADANVTLGKLASSITPSHITKFGGKHSYGGGGSSSAETVTGVAASDIIHATIEASTNAVSIVKAVPTTNTITFHFSADPGAGTIVSYSALRAAA